MPKIVYHGTIGSTAPHTWGEPFHAGTLQAADDRLDDEISHGVDWDEFGGVGISSIHAYEISDTAPTSKRTWEDPMFYENENRAVPEHKQNRIYPYTNAREHKGSTSYVIPSEFVGKQVKHLGVQFQAVIGGREKEQAVENAITAMLGGKIK